MARLTRNQERRHAQADQLVTGPREARSKSGQLSLLDG